MYTTSSTAVASAKSHQTQVDKHGSWWLGKINEPRPEEHGILQIPRTQGFTSGTLIEGNEIVQRRRRLQRVLTRKLRRLWGKKKKKATEEVKEWTEEELMALLDQKKKEQYEKEKKEEEEATDNLQSGAGCFPTDEETEDASDEEETFDTVTVDGVEYQLNKEDMSVAIVVMTSHRLGTGIRKLNQLTLTKKNRNIYTYKRQKK